jgi:hypothetical protein
MISVAFWGPAASTANAGEAGAPEAEIEITDEMIAAGEDAYYAVDRRVADAEFVVSEVFRAMMSKARIGSRTTGTLSERRNEAGSSISGAEKSIS